MADMLNIALTGLSAARAAMTTTGHNIANVNTPYYSRQRVDLDTTPAELQSYGYIGRGVDIEGVTRAYDAFVMQQLRGHTSSVSRYDVLNTLTDQVSSALGDADTGLTPDLEAFFSALHDIANSPASLTSRQVFLDDVNNLVTRVRDIDNTLSRVSDATNTGISNAVNAINELSTGIANLNKDITAAYVSPTNQPNDLLDQRDKMLVDLSKLIGVQVVSEDNGAVNVFLGDGQALVVGSTSNKLTAARSGFDPREITVRFESQADGSDLESYIVDGELGGYFELRRSVLHPAQDGLGLLAVGLTETMNEQHQEGMDLNGDLGSDLFTVGSPRILAYRLNKGDAVLSASLNDNTGPYELSYNGVTATYSLKRLSDGNIVSANFTLNQPFTVDGITIALSSGSTVNNGDKFLLQPNSQGTFSSAYNGNNSSSDVKFKTMALPVTDSSKLVRSDYKIRTDGVGASASLTNAGTATLSEPLVIDPLNANLTDTVQITFDATNNEYDVVDTTTGAILTSVAYNAAGTVIPPTGNYNGWSIQISGTPQNGDTFTVSAGYTVTRLSDDTEILSSGDLTALNTVLNNEGLDVDLMGGPPKNGDVFLLQPTRYSAASFELMITDPRKIAVAAPITTSADANNLGSGAISAGSVTDSSRTTLQDKVEIRFTSDHTFSVYDLATNTLLDTGVSYPPIVASANSNNSGTAAITAPTVVDYSNANLRDTLEIQFISPTQYQVIDITTGATLTPAGGATYTSGSTIPSTGNYNGLTFQISGTLKAGDKFEIKSASENPISYNGWAVNITGSPRGGMTASAKTGSNSGMTTISAPVITNPAGYKNANLTNTVEIRFTSTSTYELWDMTSGALPVPGTYSTGDPITYNGWQIKITDGTGTPQAGDTFQIKNDGDVFQIKSNQGGVGDNRNALEMMALQTESQFMSGNDYRGVYTSLTAEVGAESQHISSTLKSQQALLDQSTASREAISGVNLDEEAADLMRFQQAYQAAAQLIQVTNTLFSTLISAVRS